MIVKRASALAAGHLAPGPRAGIPHTLRLAALSVRWGPAWPPWRVVSADSANAAKGLARPGCWLGADLPSLVPRSLPRPRFSVGIAIQSVSGFLFFSALLLFSRWVQGPSAPEAQVPEPGHLLRGSLGGSSAPCRAGTVSSELGARATLGGAAGVNERGNERLTNHCTALTSCR